MTKWLLTLGLLAALTAAASDYQHPAATVPYAWQKPVIDGVINAAEWQGAFKATALQTTRKQISTRQATFWMMWDEEHIYLAMRSPLGKGERLRQAHRGPDSEGEVPFDDNYEIWISVDAVDTLTGQPHCSTQYIGNFAGAYYDAIHLPAVGNSRVNSYETGWQPKNRLAPGNVWEMEVAIPRASLGTTPGPFRDGMIFRGLFARNWVRPWWEQNSFEGTSVFSAIDSHTTYVMSRRAPAIQLASIGDSTENRLDLDLTAWGQEDGKVHWQYVSDDVDRQGDADVKKGVLTELAAIADIDQPGDGPFRLTVTDDAGHVLLDYSTQREFGYQRRRLPPEPGSKQPRWEPVNPATHVFNDPGDQVDLRIAYNPVRNYVRVFGDLINYDNRAAIREVAITVVGPDGKEIAHSQATIDEYLYARDVIQLGDLALGEYRVRLACVDAGGKVLTSKEIAFSREDLAARYPWWRTKRGSLDQVIPPWTPVTLEGSTFGVWGREMTIGPAGLPAAISTQNQPILAAPGRLVAITTQGEIAATGMTTKVLDDHDYRKAVQVDSSLGELAVSSRVTVEPDGMYKVEMTLTPRRPTTVNALRVVMPYQAAMAGYVHAVTSVIRSGFWYGFTPQGQGRVWDCTMLGDKTMRVGSFIPYVWLGSTKGGLCWFADSDQGWAPSDTTPAIELQRNVAGQVDLVLNLISGQTTLDQPRTITFAFQASPVKPMHPGWRDDKWWCGDTFKQYAYPAPASLTMASVPFPVKGYEATSKELVDAQHKAGSPAVPYFLHSALSPRFAPESRVFAEEWKTPYGEYGDKSLCYHGSFIDYMVYHWSKWAETCGIDGFYVDNMRPLPCRNLEHGCGYRLPDGRVQPSFQMFGTREYFLRCRAAFQEARGHSEIVLHMTNSMVIPWVGAADVAYDGEHHVIYPEMGKDFMDFWSLERMRVDYPAQWGVAVNFMSEYQGKWEPADMYRVMRAYFGEVMLFDALPTGNHYPWGINLIKMRRDFGIGGDDVTFLPYWEKTAIASPTAGVELAGWRKPGKLLLLVTNFGEKQTAAVTIDTAGLGWDGTGFIVTDAEAGYQQTANQRLPKTEDELAAEQAAFEKAEAARVARNPKLKPRPFRPNPWKNVKVLCWDGDANEPVQSGGATLRVPVERHNYRLLIVEKRP